MSEWQVIQMIAQLFGVILAVGGVWWRVEGMIRKNTDDLAAYKLHVAETYTTKASLSEQTNQIMRAIEVLSDKIDHLNGRIDGVMQARSARTRSSG